MVTGSNPEAVEDAKYPSGVKGMKDGWSALAAGATVDLVMEVHGMTALMYAAANKMLDAALLLFEFSANPNVVNKRGGTALYCAAQVSSSSTKLISMCRLSTEPRPATSVLRGGTSNASTFSLAQVPRSIS